VNHMPPTKAPQMTRMPATTPIAIFAPLLIPLFFVARTELVFPSAVLVPFEALEVVDVVAKVLEVVGEVVVCGTEAILEELVEKVAVGDWVVTVDCGDADNNEEVDVKDFVLDDEVVVATSGPSFARNMVLTTDCPD